MGTDFALLKDFLHDFIRRKGSAFFFFAERVLADA
jgi:hypothetical protein